jgi:two-component system, NarL family, sensor histidine kinase UhpB
MKASFLKILCLEDSEADAILIKEKLTQEGFNFHFDIVSTESEYSQKLVGCSYDIILSDYNLPGFNGIAALLLARKICIDVPFICISGTIGEELAVELIQLGASDYILKDRMSRLPIAVENAIREAEARKARIEAEAEVMKMKESLEMLNRHLDEIRESERAAIAREIHDQLGQSLTALKIDVNYLHDKVAEGSGEQSKLELMSGMITDMIKDVQRIASELRPPILDDLGLVSAMEWYIREFEKRTGIECRTHFDSVQFPMQKKNLTLYRIMQESLTNVSRHAEAKKVEISLTRVYNLVSFKVTDDGKGFDSNKIDSLSSLGFLGIRERLKQHNGILEIESAPGKGTRLSVTLPFN